MKLSEVPIGAIVEHPGFKYLGAVVQLQVVAKNHHIKDSGYPQNAVTLQTKDIITNKAFDAKEAGNSNSDRRNYGNNNYFVSNISQWLTSSATNWFKAQHGADVAPNSTSVVSANPYASEAGFLSNMPEEFREALLPTTITTVQPTMDGGGVKKEVRTVFLPSRTEVGLGDEVSGNPEGAKWDFYTNDASRKKVRTPQAISQATDSSDLWYLRTPDVVTARSARFVYSDGSLYHYYTNLGYGGVPPALNLSNDTEVELTGDVYQITSLKEAKIRLGDIPIGSIVMAEGVNYYDVPIIFEVIGQNHYGNNTTTLLTERIISIKSFSAKEPTNTDLTRSKYGNNNWEVSSIRQWLNSSENDWYSSTHQYSESPTAENVTNNPYNTEKGFLSNFPEDFVQAIVPLETQYVKNSVDGGGLGKTTDKVRLLSKSEVGLGETGSVTDGKAFSKFMSKDGRIAGPTREAVINSEYKHSSISFNFSYHYWLRTASPSSSSHVVRVDSTTNLGGSYAYNHNSGIRPALDLSQNRIVAHDAVKNIYIIQPKTDCTGMYVKINNQWIKTNVDVKKKVIV